MLESASAIMRLLDKYIGREVISHAFLGLAVFTFVFFVPQLVRLMELVVRHTGGFANIALLFLCTLPPVLAFSLPMAVLVGPPAAPAATHRLRGRSDRHHYAIHHILARARVVADSGPAGNAPAGFA